jgi:hypothetical protein
MYKHPISTHYEKKVPKLFQSRLLALFFHVPQMIAFLDSLPDHYSFWDIMKALEVKRWFRLTSIYKDNIPSQWPLIIVANHPHILVDQLSIWALIESVRPHSKIVTITDNAPEDLECIYPFSIQVGKTPQEKKIFRENINTLLENNGTLIVFPGAKLTHRRWLDWSVREWRWRSWALHFSRHNAAPVLPIHVTSKTSMMYNFFSNMFPRHVMQTLNFRQALKKEMYIWLTVWKLLQPEDLPSPDELRDLVYKIGNQAYILPKK